MPPLQDCSFFFGNGLLETALAALFFPAVNSWTTVHLRPAEPPPPHNAASHIDTPSLPRRPGDAAVLHDGPPRGGRDGGAGGGVRRRGPALLRQPDADVLRGVPVPPATAAMWKRQCCLLGSTPPEFKVDRRRHSTTPSGECWVIEKQGPNNAQQCF